MGGGRGDGEIEDAADALCVGLAVARKKVGFLAVTEAELVNWRVGEGIEVTEQETDAGVSGSAVR